MTEQEPQTAFLASRVSAHRTASKVRPLDLVFAEGSTTVKATGTGVLSEDEDVWLLVRGAIADGFGGVILSGPPGTSKSWYAELLARKLTENDSNRVRTVQFHPSYQYEDFVQGYVPVPASGSFEPRMKHLMVHAEAAATDPEKRLFVLVIDELSRADPARVFGEALTYIEQSKRGKEFSLASGDQVQIPENLFIVATMNEFDRGVDDVDAAFDRRLARISMDPSADLVRQFLDEAGMEDPLATRVVAFFSALQRNQERAARIGHTYFIGLQTEDDLRRRWSLQLSHVLRKAFLLNPDGYRAIEAAWNAIFESPPSSPSQLGPAAYLAGGEPAPSVPGDGDEAEAADLAEGELGRPSGEHE